MRILIYTACCLFLLACSQKKVTGSAQDELLSVYAQASSIAKDSTLTVKVRVFPAKKWEGDRQLLTKHMNYDLDSCFYLLASNEIRYPESIMPVANGMSSNFEYILTFNAVPGDVQNTNSLIYHDKYISQKDYTLLMK